MSWFPAVTTMARSPSRTRRPRSSILRLDPSGQSTAAARAPVPPGNALDDGRVLLTGGIADGFVVQAEVRSRQRDASASRRLAPGRVDDSSTLLGDGRVLLVGGSGMDADAVSPRQHPIGRAVRPRRPLVLRGGLADNGAVATRSGAARRRARLIARRLQRRPLADHDRTFRPSHWSVRARSRHPRSNRECDRGAPPRRAGIRARRGRHSPSCSIRRLWVQPRRLRVLATAFSQAPRRRSMGPSFERNARAATHSSPMAASWSSPRA